MVAPHTHLFQKLGVDMNAGVDSGQQRLDWPSWVQRLDPNIQRIQLLQGEDVVPRRAQLEQTLPRIFIHLQTEDMTWSMATKDKREHFSSMTAGARKHVNTWE